MMTCNVRPEFLDLSFEESSGNESTGSCLKKFPWKRSKLFEIYTEAAWPQNH